MASLFWTWIVATTASAVIGGFVGAFVGYLSAAFVLHRTTALDEID